MVRPVIGKGHIIRLLLSWGMTLILLKDGSEKWSGHGLTSLTGSYGPVNNTVLEGQKHVYCIHGNNGLYNSYQSIPWCIIIEALFPWEWCIQTLGIWSWSITNTGTYIYKSLSHTVCPPLTLGNGTVSYSLEMGVERNVGSVATHSCISGYRLLMQDGRNTRTCNINGWSGQDFICGE